MFQRNTTKVTVPTVTTKRVNVPTLHGLKKKVAGAATVAAGAAAAAKGQADDKAQAASEATAPKFASAGDSVSRGAEVAKDKVDDTLPKIAETVAGLLAAGTAAQHQAADKLGDTADKAVRNVKKRSNRAKDVVTGEAKKKEKRKKSLLGSLFSALVTAALAGAVIAYLRQRQAEPKDDPWARPLTDPYVAPSTGRESTVSSATTGGATAGGGLGVGTEGAGAVEGPTDAGTTAVDAQNPSSRTTDGRDMPVADLADTPAVDTDEVEIVDLTRGEGDKRRDV